MAKNPTAANWEACVPWHVYVIIGMVNVSIVTVRVCGVHDIVIVGFCQKRGLEIFRG